MEKPLAIDLFAGLGGWAEGLLDQGYDVVGFDIEARPYPAQLVLQDVLTLDGAQFRNASLIVASPPCQAYSYMAMPWTRAKALAAWYRDPEGQPHRIIALTALFDACFRIQREASEASGRYIPMVVENVKGAQPWVGRAKWHYGSFYLWGDVPALMPIGGKKKGGEGISSGNATDGTGNSSWFFGKRADPRDLRKAGDGWITPDGTKFEISGHEWYRKSHGALSSRSAARKAASAQIAKIPFPLAQHIARVYYTCATPPNPC